MLDNLMPGRLVVGLLRGTTGEYLSYGLNPTEARERTTEGNGADPQSLDRAAALRLARASFPIPHGLGLAAPAATAPSSDLCPRRQSRNPAKSPRATILGSVLPMDPFEVMGKAIRYYRDACAQYGWQPDAGTGHLSGEYFADED